MVTTGSPQLGGFSLALRQVSPALPLMILDGAQVVSSCVFFCNRFLKRKVLGMVQINGSCEWDEWHEYENLKLQLAIGKMAT
jgi:hypothetical protein